MCVYCQKAGLLSLVVNYIPGINPFRFVMIFLFNYQDYKAVRETAALFSSVALLQPSPKQVHGQGGNHPLSKITSSPSAASEHFFFSSGKIFSRSESG